MPIINKGTAFSNGEQLTADKINNLLDLATFNQSATDSASTTVNSASQIVVADSGITTAKLATDAVTFDKLADVIDDDTMATATATTTATSKSIKAYVDAGDANQIGVGQTWQNVLSSRSKNTWFQNTAGRPIQAVISIRADGINDGRVQVATDSSSSSTYIDIAILGFDSSESGTTITIPNNYYYRYTSTGTVIRTWCELR
jgi:hypothetical protein